MSQNAGTVVDSSVLLDLFTEDATWLSWSQARLVEAAGRGALILNAVVLAKIAPRFSRVEALGDALPSMSLIEEIPLAASFLAGHAHAEYCRAGGNRNPDWSTFRFLAPQRGVHFQPAQRGAYSTGLDTHARTNSHRDLHPRC